MFQQSYNSSPLFGKAADELFPNIRGDSFNGDVSLLTAMRMYLYDRLPEDEVAEAVFINTNYDEVRGKPFDDAAKACVLGDKYDPAIKNRLYIVMFNIPNKDTAQEAMDSFKSVTKIDGMEVSERMEANVFCKKDSNGNCAMLAKLYEDLETSRSIIIVFDRMTMGKMHIIASLTSRYFKRWFTEKPLTDDEKENVFRALVNEKTPEKFSSVVMKFSEQFDFRTPMIMASLTGFDHSNYARRLSAVDARLARAVRELSSWNDKYAQLLRNKRSAEEQKQAVLFSEPEGDGNSLRDYFLSNRNLHLESVNHERIRFWAKTRLGNYDKEMMEQLLKSPRRTNSEFYQYGGSSVTMEDRDLFFRSLFIDESVKLWLCGYFEINDGDCPTIAAISSFNMIPEMHDTMPNPHLWNHACMGDNKRYAVEALEMGNYVVAIDQAIGSVASVNFNEGVTVQPWMNTMFRPSHGKCFEITETGERVDFKTLMKILKKEGEA